jgi:hypothetical protein
LIKGEGWQIIKFNKIKLEQCDMREPLCISALGNYFPIRKGINPHFLAMDFGFSFSF